MKIVNILLFFIVLTFVSCDNDGDVVTIPNYPPNANLKCKKLYSSDGKTFMGISAEYEYNDKGQIAKVTAPIYDKGKSTSVGQYSLYKYNKSGELTQISDYVYNNKSKGYINLENHYFSYFPNGMKEKEVIMHPIINSYTYMLYEYDDAGRLWKISRYDKDEKLESYSQYKYDKEGNRVKELVYDNQDKVFKIIKHTFSEGNNTLTEVFTDKNEKFREIKKTYDANGNLIMEASKELSAFSSMMSFVMKYEYLR